MKKITITKFLCCMLSVITIFSLSIKVNAAERNYINLNNLKLGEEKFLSSDEDGAYYIRLADENEEIDLFTESNTIDSSSIINSNNTVNSIKSSEINKISDLKLNEKKVLSSDENGTYYITLVSETKMAVPYVNLTTSNQRFIISYKNSLTGTISDALSVVMTCDWISDGENSRIINLRGTCNILNNQFSCSWDNNHVTTNLTYHSLGLNVYRNNGASAFYVFTAIVDFYGNLTFNMY